MRIDHVDGLRDPARLRAERYSLGLIATSTHDTKRSEDVRARLAVLSEIPGPWRDAVTRWSRRNERHKTNGLPDRNLEYLYYQTLVGAFSLEPARARSYMQKAAREAKSETAWTRINPAYEAALADFVAKTLDEREFMADLAAFVEPLLHHGRINSLTQTLLKLTLPGVPDFYQGTELLGSQSRRSGQSPPCRLRAPACATRRAPEARCRSRDAAYG